MSNADVTCTGTDMFRLRAIIVLYPGNGIMELVMFVTITFALAGSVDSMYMAAAAFVI